MVLTIPCGDVFHFEQFKGEGIVRNAKRFFAYAHERYQIHLNRSAGLQKPWTNDKILQSCRFCQVFREDDRTTVWFRRNVRDRLRDSPKVLLATVVFRMFNRIESGEAIFRDDDLIDGSSAFDSFLRTGNTYDMKRALVHRQGSGPYVTGAYIISTPGGYSKLDGVLEILRRFYKRKNEWQHWLDRDPGANECGLEAAHEFLSEFDYLGRFHSYEIVTDLRHTALLERAPDIMTWASPGPGARRGICRAHGRGLDWRPSREYQIGAMRDLLLLSRDARMWPAAWPAWEMRDVEHTLCEFDKYERIRLGQGRTKGKYDGA